MSGPSPGSNVEVNHQRQAFIDHNYANTITTTEEKRTNQDEVEHCEEVWQTVPSGNKRVLNNYDKPLGQKKICKSISSSSIPITNTFAPLGGLNDNDMMIDSSESAPQKDKPPPIFIPNVSDTKSMVQTIESVIKKTEYAYKLLNNNQVKICPTSSDAYRKLVQKFKDIKICFHSYQFKKDKAYRVVLKNMHYSTELNEIKESIEEFGHTVRNISNVKHFKTKNPLSMFFIDLEPSSNNKEIFDIQFLLNAKIEFEPPYKRKEIVQCKKCQSYGHTQSYCYHPYRCVKCGQYHESKLCSKPQSEPPKCALCEGNHPASYKGCKVYKELKNKTFPHPRPRLNEAPNSKAEIPIANKPSNSQTNQQSEFGSVTYAKAAAKSPQQPAKETLHSSDSLEQTMKSFMEKFEKIMFQQSQQIGTLMNLLTTVISKLK